MTRVPYRTIVVLPRSRTVDLNLTGCPVRNSKYVVNWRTIKRRRGLQCRTWGRSFSVRFSKRSLYGALEQPRNMRKLRQVKLCERILWKWKDSLPTITSWNVDSWNS